MARRRGKDFQSCVGLGGSYRGYEGMGSKKTHCWIRPVLFAHANLLLQATDYRRRTANSTFRVNLRHDVGSVKDESEFLDRCREGLIYLELCLSRAVTGRPRLFYCLNLPQKHCLGNFVLDNALYSALQFDDGFLQREATVKIPLRFISDADQ
jgi:hypothetical protein